MTPSQADSSSLRGKLTLLVRYLRGTSNAWRVRAAGYVLALITFFVLLAGMFLLALSLESREPLQINMPMLDASRTVMKVACAMMTVLVIGWAVRWVLRYRRGLSDMVSLEFVYLSTAGQWMLRAMVLAALVFGAVFAITRHGYAGAGFGASIGVGVWLLVLDEVRRSRKQRASGQPMTSATPD